MLLTKSWHESKFVSAGAIARVRAFFGQGTGAILLDEVNCTGTEARLVDCPSNPLGVHDCGHFEDAGVTCQGILGKLDLLHTFYTTCYSNLNCRCTMFTEKSQTAICESLLDLFISIPHKIIIIQDFINFF